ncbi:D-alanyl-D-alanine carboxypeptidase [Halobacillus karajensis]|uniref:D-alanyl-D-alanine carboxypeptidase n=1 Tax=Halobacillus karajensis TaxID=195088 RepID=A0A059NZJ6_9BACI|nr:M15 family metallopeptidase [Halobacillus karajensis]CDQ21134.1 D-alanyl-D-alanine carboxypeptidase [Halobacillus karajensis]CDQ24802.1 D-alanyl-D-alanine carboxypeptidase [Halobacillus karajensis]CDQ28838.1 D-alanyl-D-alanine carboxypeptidase [Halobacillus karajensis]SEH95836.1 D-alanyl-D-alanine carboxypeptidase [Halobacillus karajensis]
MKIIWVITLLSVSLTACSIGQLNSDEETNEEVPASSTQQEQPEKTNENQDSTKSEDDSSEKGKGNQAEDKVLEDGIVEVGDPASNQVVVNKHRKLPSDYVPADLTVPDVPFSFSEDHPKKQMREEAARALEELFDAAKEDGIDFAAASGYRSFDRQKDIYERYIEIYGKEKTDTFSAPPGTSEHQTGLAMDVTSAQVAFKLEQSFGETDAGEWLADHAHEYGFIIRYKEGTEDITGYMYEPWHLRYVGNEISSDVHYQAVTLEEFFGFHPASE